MKRFQTLIHSLLVVALMLPLISSGAPASAAVPMQSSNPLRGYWQFEQNLIDSSPNHNDGASTAPITYASGILGNALSRDGTQPSITLPNFGNNNSLNLENSAITIEAWVKSSNFGDDFRHLIDNVDGYALSIFEGRVAMLGPEFWWTPINTTGPNNAPLTNPLLSLGTWHYVAGTYDGNKQALYVDGQLVAYRNTSAAVPSGQGNIGIAGYGGSGFDYAFKGLIDELRVFDYARPSTAIAADYEDLTSSSPVRVRITDSLGNLVSRLTLFEDNDPNTVESGWPLYNLDAQVDGKNVLANPLTVTLIVSDTTLTARKARLRLSDATNGARFYVFDEPAGCVPTVELHTPDSYSYKSYRSECDLAAGATGRFEWKVWVQPSVGTSLAFDARLFEPQVDPNNNPIEVILWQTLAKLVTVQQAAIYPIVFIPGLGATQPPRYGNWSIVEERIAGVAHYTDLFTTLEKMGFERDKTYFLFNYDWLNSNIISAIYLREALDGYATAAATVPWVASYGNSSSVEFDLIGHSTGNMVARTYIQVDQGFDPARNQTFPIWNDNVRRWVSIAGPLEGIWDIYGKMEGLTFPINPVDDAVMFSALYVWGLGKALDAKYARIVFRFCGLNICPYLDWGTEEKYQFAHDPVRGPTIIPEFLPTYPYLVNNNGNPADPSGDDPFGRMANPLLEDQSVVNGSITMVSQVEQAIANPNVGFNRAAMSGNVFDLYTQNPRLGSGRWGQTVPTGFQTTYYGLNTTSNLQLLNTRLGGIDQNMCLIYGGRDNSDDDKDTVDKLEVTDPSHRDVPPYWFNGRIEDVTNLQGVGYIYGPGDTYVPQLSASAEGIWQGIGVEPHRLNVDDGTSGDKSVHTFIAGYDVSVKEVARCLAGISDLPAGMLAGFSPVDHSTAQANYDAVTGRILGITALSPIELLLTDPLGRRLGYDPTTAQDVSEIPNATYIRDVVTTHKYLTVLAPATGTYALTITGTGNGPYTVVGMFKEGQNVVNVFASQGTASPGSAVSETFVTPQTAAEVPAPPDVEAGPGMTTIAGQPVTFAGSFSDINPDETHTVTWDFGDGQSASGTLTPTHTYALAGAYTATLTVTDSAGFAISDTLTVNVQYAFTGFFQPVDNLPTLNTVKAGSAVPVKFSLGGDYGLNIFATGYPSSSIVTCGSTAEDAVEETVTAGGSSLSYDATTGQYTYVWKTDKAWANTCRTLVVKLNDGASYKANFKFKP